MPKMRWKLSVMIYAIICSFLLPKVLGAGDDPPLPDLPNAYTTFMMMNIGFSNPEEDKESEDPSFTGITMSILETCDSKEERAVISMFSEIAVDLDNLTQFQKIEERVIWQPLKFHGADKFLALVSMDSYLQHGWQCMADKMTDDSFFKWLFGFDFECTDNCGFPSIANMLHWGDRNYTYKGDDVINGIEVNAYTGKWYVDAWKSDFDVTYYWSDLKRWESTSGTGKSVPVSAYITGLATIDNKKQRLNVVLDFTDFFEVDVGDSFFTIPSDLWCEGRRMEDMIPAFLPTHFSYKSEFSFTWQPDDIIGYNVLLQRSEWYDYTHYISRTDYRPPNFENLDNPFDGKSRKVSEIQDFITGIGYTIDTSLGNCSVGYIAASEVGDMIDVHGHIHMKPPLDMFFLNNTFVFNGKYEDRGIIVDAYIRTAPVNSQDPSGSNLTTVVYVSSSQISDDMRRYIPVTIVQYTTKNYNKPGSKIIWNIAGLEPYEPDFSLFDISYCFNDEPDQKLPVMIRMGWTADMDLANSYNDWVKRAREQITIWAKITAIRVTNVQYSIDKDSNAFFLIFTLLGYPKDMNISPTELPDAVRPTQEAVDLLIENIDKGYFKFEVASKSGSGIIITQAEHGSLTVGGEYSVGYSGGAMAGLGITMLIISTIGFILLLIYVFKW